MELFSFFGEINRHKLSNNRHALNVIQNKDMFADSEMCSNVLKMVFQITEKTFSQTRYLIKEPF